MPVRIWAIGTITRVSMLLIQDPEDLGCRIIAKPVLLHSPLCKIADNSSSPLTLRYPGRCCHSKRCDFHTSEEKKKPNFRKKTRMKCSPVHTEFFQIKTCMLYLLPAWWNDQYCTHPLGCQWVWSFLITVFYTAMPLIRFVLDELEQKWTFQWHTNNSNEEVRWWTVIVCKCPGDKPRYETLYR